MLLYNYAFIYYITYYYEYICYKEINISMNYFLFKLKIYLVLYLFKN